MYSSTRDRFNTPANGFGQFFGGGGSSIRHRVDGPREPDGRESDAAAHRVNQDRLPGTQRRLLPQRVMRGDEGFRNRPGFGPGQVVWYFSQQSFVSGDVFRVSAAAREAKPWLSGLPQMRLGTGLGDFSGKFQTGNFGGKPGGRGIAALTLQQIGPVQRRGLHFDEHLIGGDNRPWDRPYFEHFRPSGPCNPGGFHG